MEPAFPDDDSVPLDDRRYVPAKTLCEQYGVSEKYIVRLAIESKIDGKFLKGDLYIRYDLLDRYFGDQLEAFWRRDEA